MFQLASLLIIRSAILLVLIYIFARHNAEGNFLNSLAVIGISLVGNILISYGLEVSPITILILESILLGGLLIWICGTTLTQTMKIVAFFFFLLMAGGFLKGLFFGLLQ